MLEFEPTKSGNFNVLGEECWIGDIVKLSTWCFRCVDRLHLGSEEMRAISDKLDELNGAKHGN